MFVQHVEIATISVWMEHACLSHGAATDGPIVPRATTKSDVVSCSILRIFYGSNYVLLPAECDCSFLLPS